MILIAPDKFKGTLTASDAAKTIASVLSKSAFCFMAPMADGGEGTAAIIGSQHPWQNRNGYYVNPITKEAIIDSSSLIGNKPGNDVLRASSLALGVKVREIIKGGCEKVIIGVGGTGTCDAGVGFLEGLGLDHLKIYKDRIIGLCDVKCPLLPLDGSLSTESPSALMFAPQKGATANDIPILYERLKQAQNRFGKGKTSEFDGAGGGLGFAVATVLGAKCYSGAQYVLDSYHIDWNNVELVVTGEGCIDNQSCLGKVCDVVTKTAAEHGIPSVIIGGKVVNSSLMANQIIATDSFLCDAELTPEIAKERLRLAASMIRIGIS